MKDKVTKINGSQKELNRTFSSENSLKNLISINLNLLLLTINPRSQNYKRNHASKIFGSHLYFCSNIVNLASDLLESSFGWSSFEDVRDGDGGVTVGEVRVVSASAHRDAEAIAGHPAQVDRVVLPRYAFASLKHTGRKL